MTPYNPNNESIRVNYTCLGPFAISSPLFSCLTGISVSPLSCLLLPSLFPLLHHFVSCFSTTSSSPSLLPVTSFSVLSIPLPLFFICSSHHLPHSLSLCPSSQGLMMKLCLITMLAFNWNSIHKHTDSLTEYPLHVDTLCCACP